MDAKQQSARYLLPVVAQGLEPIVVASAPGRTVTDVDGKTYLDCFSGISVVNAGHNHPRIIAVAKEQMDKLVHAASCVYHVPVVGQLAENLAQIVPLAGRASDGMADPALARTAHAEGGNAKSFFSNSGAEAIAGAMRLAQPTHRGGGAGGVGY